MVGDLDWAGSDGGFGSSGVQCGEAAFPHIQGLSSWLPRVGRNLHGLPRDAAIESGRKKYKVLLGGPQHLACLCVLLSSWNVVSPQQDVVLEDNCCQ